MASRRRTGTREGEAEVRRVVAALAAAAGGQTALAQQLGGVFTQSTLSRFLAGGRLGRPMAETLYATYPGLRRALERVFRLQPRMPAAHDTPASSVAD